MVPAGWTAAQRVGAASACHTVTAGIDSTGRYHIAADCNGAINYFASNGLGSWSRRVFFLPAHRQEIDPQIAVQGNALYVAYTRIIPGGGCGGSLGSDVGVYFRTRTLPNGAWSAATKLGLVADQLDSFQVAGGTVHATVENGNSVYYESLHGSTYHRYKLSSAIGPAPLSVGSDGRARIVYQVYGGLRYAVFNGSGLSTSKIGGTIQFDEDPVFTLDASDHAHVVWTRYEPAACGLIPKAMYYGTNASGTWVSQRFTTATGAACIQVDDGTGRVHVLVGADSGLNYYTRTPSGSWTHVRVASTSYVGSPIIRLDQARGTLLVVYIGANSAGNRIYALTKS